MTYSPEEIAAAQAELNRRGLDNQGQALAKPTFKDIAGGLANENFGWLKGLMKGGGQALGDMGASIGNLPAEAVESLTGKRPYTIPHPDLLNSHPSSFGESMGQNIGSNLPKYALEAYLAHRVAPYGGSKMLPRLGLGGAQGAATGFATTEGDRMSGAKKGLGVGLGEGALTEFPIFKKQAGAPYRKIEKEVNKAGLENFHVDPEHLEQATPYLRQYGEDQFAIDQMLKDLPKGQYSTAHNLQSSLGKISGPLMKAGGAEHLTGRKIENLRQKIMAGMRSNLTEGGLPLEAMRSQAATDRYRRHHAMKPYLKAAGYGGVAGGGGAGIWQLANKVFRGSGD